MSTRIDALAQELEALRTEMNELDAVEEATEEQAARYDAALDEFETKKAERDALIKRAERVSAVREANLTPANRETSAPNVIIRRDPWENLSGVRFSQDEKHAPKMDLDLIGRATAAVTEHGRPLGVTDAEVNEAVRKIESVPGVANHVLLHSSPAYMAAFREWMSTQGEPIYAPEEAAAVRAAMALGNSTGGYTLPTLLDPSLIHTGTASKAPLRGVSRVVSGTQNVWHGVSVGNVSTYWTAEAAAMTEGSPTFVQPTVTAAKLTAYLKGSYEIFEDSNLQGQLPGLIAEAFMYQETDAFVTGSGSGAPKGVLTAISGTAASTVTCTTRGTFGYVDLTNLHDAAAVRYEDSSTFLANKAIFTAVRNFATASANGSLFWADLRGDNPPQLIDSNYIKASAMTSSTASGSKFLIYGDFSQFLIYDRIGTSVEFVQNVFNSSALPTGERALVAHKRVGSDVTDVNAFRFLLG